MQGVPIQTFVQEFRHVDRAILDGETDGFVKIHVRAGTDKIIGATIVSRRAGEMIGEVAIWRIPAARTGGEMKFPPRSSLMIFGQRVGLSIA